MANHLPICENCGGQTTKHDYIARYDAYICPHCNKWANKTCDELTCMFCSTRPLDPYEGVE